MSQTYLEPVRLFLDLSDFSQNCLFTDLSYVIRTSPRFLGLLQLFLHLTEVSRHFSVLSDSSTAYLTFFRTYSIFFGSVRLFSHLSATKKGVNSCGISINSEVRAADIGKVNSEFNKQHRSKGKALGETHINVKWARSLSVQDGLHYTIFFFMNDWFMTNIRPEMVIRAAIFVYRIDSKRMTLKSYVIPILLMNSGKSV